MYINPFVCGVLATIILQIISIVFFGIYTNLKDKKGR